MVELLFILFCRLIRLLALYISNNQSIPFLLLQSAFKTLAVDSSTNLNTMPGSPPLSPAAKASDKVTAMWLCHIESHIESLPEEPSPYLRQFLTSSPDVTPRTSQVVDAIFRFGRSEALQQKAKRRLPSCNTNNWRPSAKLSQRKSVRKNNSVVVK